MPRTGGPNCPTSAPASAVARPPRPADRGSRARRARTDRARREPADPLRARTSGRRRSSRARWRSIDLRVGVEVEQATNAARRDARGRRWRGGARAVGAPARAARPTLRSRRARRRCRRCGGTRSSSRSTASTPGISAGRGTSSNSCHASGGRYGTRSSSPPSTTSRSGRRRLARSSLGVNWKISCTTRFIWRTVLKPAARRDLRHREIGVVEQAAGEVRAPRAGHLARRRADVLARRGGADGARSRRDARRGRLRSRRRARRRRCCAWRGTRARGAAIQPRSGGDRGGSAGTGGSRPPRPRPRDRTATCCGAAAARGNPGGNRCRS